MSYFDSAKTKFEIETQADISNNKVENAMSRYIFQVKVEDDPEVLEKRRALTTSKTPAELAQISSIADLPIPTALEKFLEKPKPETETDDAQR